jgi:hypothetical protein
MTQQGVVSPIHWTFEPSPCEVCPRARECRQQLMACRQFQSFVSVGGRAWTSEPREPSPKIFALIYRDAEQVAA